MVIVRNKDNCILNHTAPVPWPSPLTRVVSLDSLSPVLSLAVGYGSWQTPLSWSHHLSPHWTNLWARDSAQSSRARVTSSYSHCELSLPSAGDQISGLDHFVDGSEFRTRDLSKEVTMWVLNCSGEELLGQCMTRINSCFKEALTIDSMKVASLKSVHFIPFL